MPSYVPLFPLSSSERFADLPDDAARVLYVMLLPKVDAWGRMEARPRAIAARVWPMLGRTVQQTTAAIAALAAAGLIEIHGSAGICWLQIAGWEDLAGRHLREDRRGAPEFPPPSNVTRITGPDAIGMALSGAGQVQTTPDRSGQVLPNVDVDVDVDVENSSARAAAASRADRPAKVRPGKAKRPKGTPTTRTFTDWWCSTYEATLGTPYLFTTRDGVLVARLVRVYGLDEVRLRAERALTTTDPFIAGTDRGIGVLAACFNKPVLRGLTTGRGNLDVLADALKGGDRGKPR